MNSNESGSADNEYTSIKEKTDSLLDSEKTKIEHCNEMSTYISIKENVDKTNDKNNSPIIDIKRCNIVDIKLKSNTPQDSQNKIECENNTSNTELDCTSNNSVLDKSPIENSSIKNENTQQGSDDTMLKVLRACKQGDTEALERVLSNCNTDDINASDASRWTALHEVSMKDCQFTVILRTLLERGAFVDPVDRSQNTPLFYAVLYHCHDNVRLLVEHGADINHKNGNKMSPLRIATRTHDMQTKALLLRKPYIETTVDESTAPTSTRRCKRKFVPEACHLPEPTTPPILKSKKRRLNSNSGESKKGGVTINEEMNQFFEF